MFWNYLVAYPILSSWIDQDQDEILLLEIVLFSSHFFPKPLEWRILDTLREQFTKLQVRLVRITDEVQNVLVSRSDNTWILAGQWDN